MPGEWRARLRAWRRLNRRHRALVHGQPAPDANEECYLYQTLLGAWPTEPVSDAEHAAFTERITQHMLKAVKEAKVHASWIHPSPEYDDAIARFVAAILDRSEPPPREPGRLRRLIGAIVPGAPSNAFLADFRPFQQRIAAAGIYNSLAQTLLKLVAPGVPDIYQGTEEWALTLVDPDNRRPVDYARLGEDLRAIRAALEEPESDRAALARSLLATKEDGRLKLYVTHLALGVPATARVALRGGRLRAARRSRIAERSRGGVLARARGRDRDRGGATVPRPTPSVGSAGGERRGPATWLELPEERAAPAYRNVFTGERMAVTVREAGRGWRWRPSSRSSRWRSSRRRPSAEPITGSGAASPERR